MKKNYFILLLSLSQILFSQCQKFPQILTDPIFNLVFFDKNHLAGIGGTSVINTENEGQKWNLLPYPIDHRYYQLYDSKKINDSTAILVGYHGKILKTTDKGITWNNQSLAFNGDEYLESVDFVNDSVGYIFGDYKYYEPNYFNRLFYKTKNGGEKWEKVDSNINNVFSQNVSSAQIKFLNEDVGFLYYRYELYRTLDGGKNWVQIKDFYFSNIGIISSFQILDENTLVMCFDGSLNGKIYTSKDLGETWQNIPELQYPNNIYLSSKIVVKNRILYGISNESLLKYNFDTKEIIQKPIANINHNLYGYSGLFAIHVLDDSNIALSFIASTGNSGRKIVKTNNGGESWETIMDTYASYGDNYKMINQNQKFLLSKWDYSTSTSYAQSYGIYLSEDNALSWKEIDKINVNEQVWPKIMGISTTLIDGNYLSYIYQTSAVDGTTKYYLKESNDLGETWTLKQMNFQDNYLIASRNITQIDQNILFFSNNYSYGFVSLDKGNTWKKVIMPTISNFSFYGMKFIKNDEIYAWGRYQNLSTNYDYSLYKTKDQGDSWEEVVRIPDNNGNDMGYITEFTVFGSDYAFVSTGGKTFFKINLNTKEYSLFDGTIPGNPVYTNSLKILNDNFWYHPGREADYKDGTYFYSNDKGKTWKEQICFICTGNVYLNDKEELLIANNNLNIEKIQGYQFDSAPKIFGNTEVDLDSTEEYFIAQDLLSETEWTLESGGIMTFDPLTKFYKIKVNWKNEGSHIIKVRKANSCEYSPYYSLSVIVKPKLSTSDVKVKNTLIISPNPFKNKIQISGLVKNESLKINLYDTSGKNVLTKSEKNIKENNYIVFNLDNLVKGIYFIEIIQAGKSTMKKILRE